MRDFLVQRGNEVCYGGEVGLGVGGQGHEDDVLSAALLDLPTGGDAPRVGVEDDLEQNGGVVGRGAGLVILVPEVEDGKVDLVVDEIVEGVLEGAGKDLLVEADGDELALGIVVMFVSRHRSPALRGFGDALMRFDGVNIAQNEFFYSFNGTLRGAILATLSSVLLSHFLVFSFPLDKSHDL